MSAAHRVSDVQAQRSLKEVKVICTGQIRDGLLLCDVHQKTDPYYFLYKTYIQCRLSAQDRWTEPAIFLFSGVSAPGKERCPSSTRHRTAVLHSTTPR